MSTCQSGKYPGCDAVWSPLPLPLLWKIQATPLLPKKPILKSIQFLYSVKPTQRHHDIIISARGPLKKIIIIIIITIIIIFSLTGRVIGVKIVR